MTSVQKKFSLKNQNTFGIEATADFYSEFSTADELRNILLNEQFKNLQLLILGGGSNVLFTKNFEGLVLKNKISGIKEVNSDSEFVYLKSGAGVAWHDLVVYCIDHNLAGVENLSLIPGSVGAAPMQNIGAYGVELKEVFHSLEAMEIKTGNIRSFSKEECHFGYRESVFKNIYKNQYVILNVTLKLNKHPKLNTSYGAIAEELKKMNVAEIGIREISNAVMNIRRSKLPDPKVTGNAGSFFKNPEIPESDYLILKKSFPELVAYPASKGNMKLAAGWLIEQCGWKGKAIGNAAVHSRQALVLVNAGNANGIEIFQLAQSVQQSVKEKFDVSLEMEVNII